MIFEGGKSHQSEEDFLVGGRRIRTLSDPPIPEKRKLAYALGAMPRAAMNQIATIYFTAYLLQVALLPPAYASMVIIFGRILDAATDPFLGYIFARTSTRFGKYRPWLLFSAPVPCICFALLWYVPSHAGVLGKLFYYMFIYWFYFIGLTCFYVPLISLAISSTNSPAERDILTTRRMSFEYLGSILGVGLQALLLYLKQSNFDPTETCGYSFTHDQLASGTKSGNATKIPVLDRYLEYRNSLYVAHFTSGIIISVVFFICAIIAACFSLEERYHLHIDSMSFSSLLRHYRDIFKFKPYYLLAAIYFLLAVALTAVVGNYQLYFKYALHYADIFPLYVFILYLMSALSAGIWHSCLLKKFGKKTTATLAALPLLIILWYHLYLQGNLTGVLSIGFLAGIFLGGIFLVPNSMAPDAIASYSVQHGYGKESLFYTVVGSLDKFGIGLTLGFSALMLNVANFQITNPCRQPDNVEQALRILISAVPVIALTIALILLWEYPITEYVRSQMSNVIKKSMSGLSNVNSYGSTLPLYTDSVSSLSSRSGSMSKHEKPTVSIIPREKIVEIDTVQSSSSESGDSYTRNRTQAPKRKYGTAGLEAIQPIFYLADSIIDQQEIL